MNVVFMKEIDSCPNVLFRGVDFLNHRNSDVNPSSVCAQPAQVVQNPGVVSPHVFLVNLRIHRLHIVQEGAYVRQHCLKPFVWRLTASVHRNIDALTVQFFCQRQNVFRIDTHNLSAGKGHSAAGLFVEHLIFQKFLHQRTNLVLMSQDIPDAARTSLYALTAKHALQWVGDRLAVLNLDGIVWTGFHTESASNAFCFIKLHLWIILLGLRVMAPNAVQRTSFEEHRRPNSITVMHREFLNIRNRVHLFISLSD